jgi:hypothetical protein
MVNPITKRTATPSVEFPQKSAYLYEADEFVPWLRLQHCGETRRNEWAQAHFSFGAARISCHAAITNGNVCGFP